jgi:2-polyprenyl-3-methyl-5-hydroxy-6-metoxy-1,4-benzoquinol methylase
MKSKTNVVNFAIFVRFYKIPSQEGIYMTNKNNEIEELLKREEEFHDEWALSENVDDIDVNTLFESFIALENNFIMKKLGDLKGKKILDVGAGLGESSVYFALQGAEVYYNDISPKMGEFAEKLANKYGVKLQYMIAPIEKLELYENFFDVIHCANLIHHVPQVDQDFWIKTMSQSLKKGGTLVTWDPLRYNPVINVYRRMAMEVRTIDEMPVGFDILKLYKKYFSKVEHKEFWFTTLWIFLHYYLVRRYDPNKIRYWKRIFKEKESRIGWWFKPMKALDSLLLTLPGFKHMAWSSIIVAKK